MGRQLKFTIVKCTRGAKIMWRIRMPARFAANGHSTDLYYDTKKDAKVDQCELLRRYTYGELVGAELLNVDQVREAKEAFRLLHDIEGVGLVDAVKIALATLKAQLKGISVEELLERYSAEVSVARNWSTKYKGTWRHYSSKFVEAFGNRNIATITAVELREWYATTYTSTATYYNSALAVLAPSFAWAVKQELIEKSPYLLIERRKVIASDGVDVFTVREAKHLLATCTGELEDAGLAFAILLFAGIRPEELTKLTWDDVMEDAEGMFIHIRPTVAKTRQVRNVRVRDNLKAMLLAIPKESRKGKLIPSNWKRKASAVRELSGFKNRSNAARHSFASYSLALDGNIDAVRSDMGHARGSDMLFKHYRAAVTKEQALLYWQLP